MSRRKPIARGIVVDVACNPTGDGTALGDWKETAQALALNLLWYGEVIDALRCSSGWLYLPRDMRDDVTRARPKIGWVGGAKDSWRTYNVPKRKPVAGP